MQPIHQAVMSQMQMPTTLEWNNELIKSQSLSFKRGSQWTPGVVGIVYDLDIIPVKKQKDGGRKRKRDKNMETQNRCS